MLVKTMDVVRQADYAAADRLAIQVYNRPQTNDQTVDSEVRDGRPSELILNRAVELAADMLVIGARVQTCAEPFQLGGVAQKVVKYAPSSVILSAIRRAE